jgi:hypothetical protein
MARLLQAKRASRRWSNVVRTWLALRQQRRRRTGPGIPAAPVATSGSAVAPLGFTAGWAASNGATGYRLDVSTSSDFTSFVPGFQDLAVGNVTSYEVTGLAMSTDYWYRVRASNGVGVSGNSNAVTVTTTGVVSSGSFTATIDPGWLYFNYGFNGTGTEQALQVVLYYNRIPEYGELGWFRVDFQQGGGITKIGDVGEATVSLDVGAGVIGPFDDWTYTEGDGTQHGFMPALGQAGAWNFSSGVQVPT